MLKHLKIGNLCADKIRFQGIDNCCIWYPDPDAEDELGIEDIEGTGLCFDFCLEDIDDMIALLEILKICPPMSELE